MGARKLRLISSDLIGSSALLFSLLGFYQRNPRLCSSETLLRLIPVPRAPGKPSATAGGKVLTEEPLGWHTLSIRSETDELNLVRVLRGSRCCFSGFRNIFISPFSRCSVASIYDGALAHAHTRWALVSEADESRHNGSRTRWEIHSPPFRVTQMPSPEVACASSELHSQYSWVSCGQAAVGSNQLFSSYCCGPTRSFPSLNVILSHGTPNVGPPPGFGRIGRVYT